MQMNFGLPGVRKSGEESFIHRCHKKHGGVVVGSQVGGEGGNRTNGAFTLDVKSVLNENLGDTILNG
jgi:hypothetical protein